MAISAISGNSAAPPRLPGNASGSAREAELERQIAAKVSLARCTDCEQTAEKANKDAENLRAQLAALKAKEFQGARSTLPTPDVPGAAALAAATNSEPSQSADPYSGGNTQDNTEVDTRPIAARASPAVQAALSDLNSADNSASAPSQSLV
jgi:hypothetical protein